MLHELWIENEHEQTFCLAGPLGDGARRLLAPGARLAWTCEADSHFEAMTKYHEYMGWTVYSSDYPDLDKIPYSILYPSKK